MTITILTAALNPGGAIRDCLDSVAGQKLPADVEVEHAVLDGGSSDGTLALLDEWSRGVRGREFRSGRDGGFYEALNGGLDRARGDVIGILNADDFYFDDRVLARVAEAFSDPGASVTYGDLVYLTSGSSRSSFRVRRYWKSGGFREGAFRWGWMPPHPTVFARREVYVRCGGFRTDFGSAADYEWILRVALKNRIPFRYIPHVLIAMREGGMSNRSMVARLAANRNDRRAWTENGLAPLPWTLLMKPLRKIPQWFAPLE